VVWLIHKHSPKLKQKMPLARKLASGTIHTVVGWIIFAVVTICTIHLFFYAHTGLAFASNGFYDRQGSFQTKGTYHPYSQVVSLNEVTSSASFLGTYNDYVLTLKDGTTYSLSSGFGASSTTVTGYIAPMLEDAGVTVHLIEEEPVATESPLNS
jgi:hypothetical protein